MRNFIAVMFPSEGKAYEGLRALGQLHGDGTITLYETIVIEREADGAVVTKMTSRDEPRRTGLGAVLGAVIGVLGGPVGVVLGATAGGFAGAMDDAIRATVGNDYAEKIGQQLAPATFAVLAEVHEDDPSHIDARMSEVGGKVLRETRTDFFEDQLEKQAQERRAAVDEYEQARASERAERKELYLEADLREARTELQRTADAAREQLDKTKLELDEKIKAVEAQIAKAPLDARKELDQRMLEIRNDLGERQRKLSHALEIAADALHLS